MYPTQTSLIPATVALVRYIKNFGIFGNYPFWYLGTTPTKYLIGPILPYLEIAISKTFLFSFFDISIYIVLFSYFISIIGWTLLIYKLSNNKKLAFLSVFFLLIFPWRIFSSLTIQETSYILARNFTPFILISFYSFAKKNDFSTYIISLILHIFILLIHTGIIPILLVFEFSVALSLSYKRKKFVNITKYIKNIFALFLTSITVVSFWYGPRYWSTILFNPSLGGLSGLKVIGRILEIFRWFIPVFLAVLVTKFSNKKEDKLKVFTSLFITFFAVLTFYRFISDYDFWMDWSTWLFEIEIGFAILFSNFLISINKISFSKAIYSILIMSFPFFLTIGIFVKMEKPVIISSKPPHFIEALTHLKDISKDKLVFLSGSSVFWANAFTDIHQIRGGRDEVVVDANWNTVSYDLRESNNINTIIKRVVENNIEYILIHTNESREYYKDFKNQNIWPKVGILVFDKNGDFIYKLIPEENPNNLFTQ